MHPEEIKAAMRIKGVTMSMLADEMGVSVTSVARVVNGTTRSQRIQDRVSDIVGKPVKVLWPAQVRLRRTRAEIEAQKARASA